MKKEKAVIIEGFKGFDKDLKCRDFQFTLQNKFQHEGEISLCNKGFHFCEHPLDVFHYYAPSTSRYAAVQGSGQTETKEDKTVCSTLDIGAEISLHGMVDAAVKFVFKRVKWTKKSTVSGKEQAASSTGDYGAASSTGNHGAASSTGYQGAASSTGDYGAASSTGNHGAASSTGDYGAASSTGNHGAASSTGKGSCAISLGIEGKAKAAVGCFITLAEWKEISNEWHRVDVKSVKVGGKEIKADTWYSLKDGKFEVVL